MLLIGILLMIVCLPLLVSWYTIRQLHATRKRSYRDHYTTSPFETNIPFETIGFQTRDGVNLRGWLMGKKGNKIVIGCHGHHGKKSDLIGIASGLVRKGLRVFIFDLRNCGESSSARQSIAFYEQQDLKAAIEYIESRFKRAKIGLIGFSMGGALSLLIAPSAPGVKAVITDCSFASLNQLMYLRYARWRLSFLAGVMIWFTDKINQWVNNYSLRSIAPVDAVKKNTGCAYLFLHGSEDPVIPVAHSKQLFADCASHDKELKIENTDHCGQYFLDRQKYIDRAATFFKKKLV